LVHTETEIYIEADPMAVYRLGAATERWPEFLEHYRWVNLLEQEGDRKVVEMAARRDFLFLGYPVRWTAEQILYPDEPRIAFRHIGGITKGMEVEWIFTRHENGVTVAIVHELDLKWPLIGGFAANYVIGPVFIQNIAGKTLRRVKQLAESGQPVDIGAST
jgi:ribosome-associated toxin RatA of RatAB toxin-antitoxin module